MLKYCFFSFSLFQSILFFFFCIIFEIYYPKKIKSIFSWSSSDNNNKHKLFFYGWKSYVSCIFNVHMEFIRVVFFSKSIQGLSLYIIYIYIYI
ncbi:hypothetical protein BDA99DRAFT_205345 [Phascolomyces articulosus]|uniref:Uncharacterized protein n=1 Tax=Phascolomyces articulosus TaxID=60185 RepID=A0AAD5K4T1_9FUNG|nr:hypothetical protein BDA99DRAFT_205345 [Phascolomyces articulosus]